MEFRHYRWHRSIIRCVVLFLLTLFGAAHAEEPLPPDQAFRFSARVVDGKTIEAR